MNPVEEKVVHLFNDVIPDRYLRAVFIGPMPVSTFLESFLEERHGRKVGGETFESMRELKGDASSAALLDALSCLCPSHTGFTTHVETPFPCGEPPSISMHALQDHRPPLGDHTQASLFGHILPDADDAFLDAGEEFTTVEGAALRVRLTSCAQAIFRLQLRTHLFSFCIFGHHARLFRWDVGGVIVTEKFDYSRTDFLAEFLWRFEGMSPAGRGEDDSVIQVDADWPTHLAPSRVLVELRDHDGYYETNDARSPVQRHRRFGIVKLPDPADPTLEKDALVSLPPKYEPRPLFGRAVQVMWAYDLRDSRLLFVRQNWRATRQKEGDVYTLLASKGVRNLPNLAAGNDVRSHCTKTQDYLDKPWSHGLKHIPDRSLHRVALSTTAVPLTEFRTTAELVGAVRDAMQCHDDAFFEAHILHRDISVENIMIDRETRKGMLVGWDLSTPARPDGHIDSDERIGSWCFMSSELQTPDDPTVRHSLLDDRESALYVLVWILLLYVAHDRYEDLDDLLLMFFEYKQVVQNGRVVESGGDAKRTFLWRRDFYKQVKFKGGDSAAKLITFLQTAILQRYIPDTVGGLGVCNLGEREPSPLAQRIMRLWQQDWLVRVLTAALDDEDWRDSTLAQPNYVVQRKQPRREQRKIKRRVGPYYDHR